MNKELLNRVARLGFLFWVIKIFSTTVGETAADRHADCGGQQAAGPAAQPADQRRGNPQARQRRSHQPGGIRRDKTESQSDQAEID